VPVQPLGDRASWYKNDFLQGCIDKYLPEKKHKRCLNNERERVEMNFRQPQSMVVSKDWMAAIAANLKRDEGIN
jgi:hypothetical protein